MAQKRQCNMSTKRILEDRGALLNEESDLVKKYKANHEDNFLRPAEGGYGR